MSLQKQSLQDQGEELEAAINRTLEISLSECQLEVIRLFYFDFSSLKVLLKGPEGLVITSLTIQEAALTPSYTQQEFKPNLPNGYLFLDYYLWRSNVSFTLSSQDLSFQVITQSLNHSTKAKTQVGSFSISFSQQPKWYFDQRSECLAFVSCQQVTLVKYWAEYSPQQCPQQPVFGFEVNPKARIDQALQEKYGKLRIYKFKFDSKVRKLRIEDQLCTVFTTSKMIIVKKVSREFENHDSLLSLKLHNAATVIVPVEGQVIIGNQRGSVNRYNDIGQQVEKYCQIHSKAVHILKLVACNRHLLNVSSSPSQIILWHKRSVCEIGYPLRVIPLLNVDLRSVSCDLEHLVSSRPKIIHFYIIVKKPEGGAAGISLTINSSKAKKHHYFRETQNLLPVLSSHSLLVCSQQNGSIWRKQGAQSQFQMICSSNTKNALLFQANQTQYMIVSGGKSIQLKGEQVYFELQVKAGRLNSEQSTSLLRCSQPSLLFSGQNQFSIIILKNNHREIVVFRSQKEINIYRVQNTFCWISGVVEFEDNLYFSACGLFLKKQVEPLPLCINHKPQKLFLLRVDSKGGILLGCNKLGFIKFFDLKLGLEYRKMRPFQSQIVFLEILQQDRYVISDGRTVNLWSDRFRNKQFTHESDIGGFVYLSNDKKSIIIRPAQSYNYGGCTLTQKLLEPDFQFQGGLVERLKQYFSYAQITNFSMIMGNVQPNSLDFILADAAYNLFYFNAAILYRKDRIISFMIEYSLQAYTPDHLFLDVPPLLYAISQQEHGIVEMLIRSRIAKGIYNKLFYNIQPQLLAEYIHSFFTSDMKPHFQPLHAPVSPVESPSPRTYRLPEEDRLLHKKAVRLVRLGRGADLSAGSDQLIQLLNSFNLCLNEKLIKSDASLIIEHLWDRHSVFFLLNYLLTASIYSFQIYSVLTDRQDWINWLGLTLALLLLLYQFMTFSNIHDYFNDASNWLDLAGILLLIAFQIIQVSVGTSSPAFKFSLVLICSVRVAFCLKIFQYLRHFLYIFQKIVKGIGAFASFILLFTLLFVFAGTIIVQTVNAASSVSQSMLAVIQAIYFGSVSTEGFDEMRTDLKFLSYLNVMLGQVVVALFMLNGILVGIVTGIYQRLDEERQLIFLKEKVQALLEIQFFYSNFYRWVIPPPEPTYTHALLTCVDREQAVAKAERDQEWEQTTEEEFRSENGMEEALLDIEDFQL